ncbi:MAG: hypothetical protein ABIF71_03550 [Planctomycetota bacterium]
MKRYVGVALLCGLWAGAVSAEVYENQSYIDRPESQKWFVYLDFNLDMYSDLYVASLDLGKDNTLLATAFDYDNAVDIVSRTNNFRIGVANNFIDKEDEGTMAWYFGAGSSNTNIDDLFPGGSIGAKGWGLEGGIQGDLFKFGSLLDKGVEIDCSLDLTMATGDSNGIVDGSYDIMAGTLNAAAYYKAKVSLQDTEDTFVYIGGKVAYTSVQLSIDLDTPDGDSGTGDYALTNQGINQVFLVLGTKFCWEANRSTADVRITGSLDGSYTVGVRLLQTF